MTSKGVEGMQAIHGQMRIGVEECTLTDLLMRREHGES